MTVHSADSKKKILHKNSKPQGKNEHFICDPYIHYKRLGREFAMQYLFQCDLRTGFFEPDTLEYFWEQAVESGAFSIDRTFRKAKEYAERLIGLVQEHETELMDKMTVLSKRWDVERMSSVDRNILKVAIAEMHFCHDIPLLVSINEAIEISKDYSDSNSGIFINGILNEVKNIIESSLKRN